MIKLSRSMKLALMVIVALVLILAACGGDEATPTSEPTSVAPTETPAETPADAPAAPESPLQQESPLPPSGDTAPQNDKTIEAPAMAYSAAPPTYPTSAPKTGTVTGRLVSSTSGAPLNHEIVRLAEVECPEGVEPADKRSKCVWTLSNAFSPSTFTDENGFFVFNDLDPRDYVVIVGDMIGKNTKLADENGPFMWEALSDEVTDIGEFHIEW